LLCSEREVRDAGDLEHPFLSSGEGQSIDERQSGIPY